MCQRPYAINLAVPHRQASSPRLLRIIRVNPPMQIVSSLVQRLLTLPHRPPPPPPPHHPHPAPHPHTTNIATPIPILIIPHPILIRIASPLIPTTCTSPHLLYLTPSPVAHPLRGEAFQNSSNSPSRLTKTVIPTGAARFSLSRRFVARRVV